MTHGNVDEWGGGDSCINCTNETIIDMRSEISQLNVKFFLKNLINNSFIKLAKSLMPEMQKSLEIKICVV